MNLEIFRNEKVKYLETTHIKEGVSCDVYSFVDDSSKDLGVVHVQPETRTPLQKIVKGDKTIEGLLQGAGKLTVKAVDGHVSVYELSELNNQDVQVNIGEQMQWEATTEKLIFFEICYPPYTEGRFENL